MLDDTAINVQSVSKDFVLPHEKTNSLKSLFTGLSNNRNGGQEKQHALRGVSFDIKQGEFFGIVGRNGSGKSTLLKILAGIYRPNSGNVTVRGKLVPFIELGVGFNPELSGRENVYLNGAMLGFSDREVDAMYDDIVTFAELERFMDQKLKNYSSGMQVRLAFSMAIRSEADILLIDEVLAVGDADFQRKCFEYFKSLKKNGKTVVFVGHDMDAVRAYCDRGILIEDGQITTAGSANKVASAYSRLFMEVTQPDANRLNDQTKHYGNQKVSFTKVSCQPSGAITDDDKELKLTTELIVKEDQEDLVVGFKIKTGSGALLCGTNTTLQGKKLTNLKKDQHLKLVWTIPNILNDGKHDIDLAIESSTGEVFDWWEEAISIKSIRMARTGFLTAPTVKLEVDRDK